MYPLDDNQLPTSCAQSLDDDADAVVFQTLLLSALKPPSSRFCDAPCARKLINAAPLASFAPHPTRWWLPLQVWKKSLPPQDPSKPAEASTASAPVPWPPPVPSRPFHVPSSRPLRTDFDSIPVSCSRPSSRSSHALDEDSRQYTNAPQVSQRLGEAVK